VTFSGLGQIFITIVEGVSSITLLHVLYCHPFVVSVYKFMCNSLYFSSLWEGHVHQLIEDHLAGEGVVLMHPLIIVYHIRS